MSCTTVFKDHPFDDFKKSDVYPILGWESYLQVRARQFREKSPMWLETTAPLEATAVRRFSFVQPLYAQSEDDAAYGIKQSIIAMKNERPSTQMIATSYDGWGRAMNQHNFDLSVQVYNGRKDVKIDQRMIPLHRQGDLTVLESELMEYDTENYNNFLNAYYEPLHQKMGPYIISGTTHQFKDTLNKHDVILAPHPSYKQNEPLGEMVTSLYNQNGRMAMPRLDHATKETTMARHNRITVMEAFRLALADEESDIFKKYKDVYGSPGFFSRGKKHERDMMRGIDNMSRFTPSPQYDLE